MEEQLNSLAVTHLLQCTLRSLCIHENSQWVYAVFWRILPRNYPPPKWDSQGAYDRSRGNRRNWILVWEDGFCNFAASTTSEMNSGECPPGGGGSSAYANSEYQHYQGLQPELFFKMSHEIYNYGEGLIGKVAADHSHKWIYKEPNDQEINFLSAWHNSADSQPRTWEAQFQSGIKTIALIAVREGVIQLGAIHKVIEDLSDVVLLRKKFSYIESIPGVLLPHPSSSPYPFINHGGFEQHQQPWQQQQHHYHHHHQPTMEYYHDHQEQPIKITPSMSSLEALLSKLPSVVPASSSSPSMVAGNNNYCIEAASQAPPQYLLSLNSNIRSSDHQVRRTKEEYDDDDDDEEKDVAGNGGGENGSSMSMTMAASYRHHQQQHYGYHHDLNVSSSMPNSGY